MGYGIAVYIIALILGAIGSTMMRDGSILGAIIVLVAALTFLAGLMGMSYKVIADGVEKGVTAANTGNRAGGTANTQQQGSGRTVRQQTGNN